MEEKIIYKELSYKIVGLAIQVRKELGFGFLEKTVNQIEFALAV